MTMSLYTNSMIRRDPEIGDGFVYEAVDIFCHQEVRRTGYAIELATKCLWS
jgi:hypothetical protein